MREPPADEANRRWAIAWACMAAATALHVTDEALTGFLPLYNSIVESARAAYGWIVPFPTFTFRVWLGGLILAVIVVLASTPLVRRGYPWLRPVSYFLGALMVSNALGHIAASVWLGRPAPGVYSSPVILAAAVALLVTTVAARRAARSGAG